MALLDLPGGGSSASRGVRVEEAWNRGRGLLGGDGRRFLIPCGWKGDAGQAVGGDMKFFSTAIAALKRLSRQGEGRVRVDVEGEERQRGVL